MNPQDSLWAEVCVYDVQGKLSVEPNIEGPIASIAMSAPTVLAPVANFATFALAASRDFARGKQPSFGALPLLPAELRRGAAV